MKKLKSILLMAVASCLILCNIAFAVNVPNIIFSPAPVSDVYPIASTTRTFDLDTSTGLVLYEGSLQGTEKVTKSEVSAVIQRYEGGKWVNVSGTSVKATNNADHASFDKSIYVRKGYEYRMEITYAVYVNGTRYVEVAVTKSTTYK